ncbi:MAG: hypothetical protein P1V20_20215 [Verrucomicrobiales bacterium]|nr:hypothetical protein [Verrucomicrobiales bacterium]
MVWLILLAFPFLFAGIWCFVCLLLSGISGWKGLADRYGVAEPVEGEVRRFQSGMIGVVSYRNTLNVTVSEKGLGLAVLPIFRPGHAPLFIPWEEVASSEVKKIFGIEVVNFRVGNVKIRLPNQPFSGLSFLR